MPFSDFGQISSIIRGSKQFRNLSEKKVLWWCSGAPDSKECSPEDYSDIYLDMPKHLKMEMLWKLKVWPHLCITTKKIYGPNSFGPNWALGASPLGKKTTVSVRNTPQLWRSNSKPYWLSDCPLNISQQLRLEVHPSKTVDWATTWLHQH